MHVELETRFNGAVKAVVITCENAYSPWALTLSQAKELHEQLGALLWENGEIDSLFLEMRDEEKAPPEFPPYTDAQGREHAEY